MPNGTQYSFIRQWWNLICLLKYGITFSILLMFLPLTVILEAPLHNVTGSLFEDLTAWGIFFAAIWLLGAVWSVMFTEGLIVDGIGARIRLGGAVFRRGPKEFSRYVPAWAEELFGVPITLPQFTAFSFLALPGFVVVFQNKDPQTSWIAAIIGLVCGAVVAYLGMILLCLPARLADQNFRPLDGLLLADRIWGFLSCRFLQRIADRASCFVSWICRHAHLSYLLKPLPNNTLLPQHFLSVTVFLLLVLVLYVMTWVVRPGNAWGFEFPALGFLYILVMVLIWTFSALHFHLARLRISPLLAVGLVVMLGYKSNSTDHHFSVLKPCKDEASQALTPADVARFSRKPKNLVVVATSGGGIQAAGWTTLALKNLIGARESLKDEIRLISGISGGSVGAAFYLYDLLENNRKEQENPVNPRRDSPALLHEIYLKATESSLGAVTYGFAFLDFWRLISGGLLPWSPDDRGTLLEREWARIAKGEVKGKGVYQYIRKAKEPGRAYMLRGLRERIRQGTIPAPIFGATIMESGRRVMITPVNFPQETRDGRRAETLSEFLNIEKKGLDYDVSLWTAARLSATFPYVSPAAAAGLVDAKDQQRQHIIDGGYYDNFGVTSALDFLSEVLEARLKDDSNLNFERVLIIQLRASKERPPEKRKPQSGAVSALAGPIVGILNIYGGAAFSRNEIDVNRFVDVWNARFRERNPQDPKVCVASVTFEPQTDKGGALSWQLSHIQKKELAALWTLEFKKKWDDLWDPSTGKMVCSPAKRGAS